MNFAKVLTFTFLAMATEARADTFLTTQHAGYAGHVALGLSYSGDDFGSEALFGWTPKHLAGHDVRSLSLKGHWYLFSIGHDSEKSVRPYLGLGAFYSPDEELFLKLPEQYPKGYYVPSALRPAFFAGIRLQLNSRVSTSLEYALLDSELAYVKNRGSIAYDQVGSVGFAVHFKLFAD